MPGLKDSNTANMPALSTATLTKDVGGKPRKGAWNLRYIVGILNFLANSTQPEIAYVVHQCAGFCENTKHSHEIEMNQIVKCLLSIERDKSKHNKSL